MAAAGTMGLEQVQSQATDIAIDAATQAVQSVDFGNGLMAGLASAVLTAAINYFGQALKRG